MAGKSHYECGCCSVFFDVSFCKFRGKIVYGGGLVKTEIIAENWDGRTYQLTAKIEADPEAVTRAIDELRKNQQQRDDLVNIGNVNEQAMERIEGLKEEMAAMQKSLIDINRDYAKSNKMVSAWDLAEKGLQLVRTNNFQPGIEVFTKAYRIELRLPAVG